MECKPLRAQCLRVAIHDISNALTVLAQSPPERLALASRQELYETILIESSQFSANVLHADPVLIRSRILHLAAACAFALASIDQGEIDW